MKQQERKTGIVILRGVVFIFVVLVIAVCPLLVRNKFYDLHVLKIEFIRISSLALIALVFVIEMVRKWGEKEKLNYSRKITSDMVFIGMLLLAAGISAILGGNLSESFWGSSGRKFGMLMMLLCIVIHYIIGKNFHAGTGFIWFYLIANSLVILIGILNFWGIDPLGTYDRNYTAYISTIGNTNVYNSYLCIIIPIGMVLYFLCDTGFSKIIYAMFLTIGFYGAYTSISDSWILGIGISFVVLLWFALKNAKTMKKYYELCGFFWLASILIRITVFAANALGISTSFLSAFSALKLQNVMTNGGVLLIEGILLIILMMLNKNVENEKINSYFLKWKKIIFILMGVCLLVFLILVIVVNIWKNWGAASQLKMLLLTDGFGSNRGYIWKITVRLFKELPVLQQIFGVGMNCFWSEMPLTFQNEIRQYLNGAYLADAHNEFLQYLVTTGVVGVAGYFGFLFYRIYSWGKKAAENPMLIIGVVTITSYLAQGLVNNPQVFITTYLFVILGVVKSMEQTGLNY